MPGIRSAKVGWVRMFMLESAAAKRGGVVGRLWAMGWCVVCVLAAMMALAEAGFAQQAVTPDAATVLGHVVKMAPLETAGSAADSGVRGTVVLRVEVGTDGSVVAAKAISGPEAL